MTIRDYIKKNFKDCNEKDITDSIENSLMEMNEETLPGLGVLFETLWNNIGHNEQQKIVNIIAKNL